MSTDTVRTVRLDASRNDTDDILHDRCRDCGEWLSQVYRVDADGWLGLTEIEGPSLFGYLCPDCALARVELTEHELRYYCGWVATMQRQTVDYRAHDLVAQALAIVQTECRGCAMTNLEVAKATHTALCRIARVRWGRESKAEALRHLPLTPTERALVRARKRAPLGSAFSPN